MTKVNKTVKRKNTKLSLDRLAGGSGKFAAKQGAEAQLRRAVMACLLWENLAYESGTANAENIASLIPQVDPIAVANIAVECRTKQKLRHVPLYIACEMAKYPTHKPYVPYVLENVITRADQLADTLAIYWKNQKNAPLATCIKKGLAAAFHTFNEYQYGKYDRDSEVKLRDVMFLVHPTPNNKAEEKLFKAIANRTLKTPDTWEVSLSAGKDKKATWERLIKEGRLGALAFLRNLRNMKNANVDHNIIRKGFDELQTGMLLPLNYLSALKYAPEFARELEQLLMRNFDASPKLTGHTVFVVDVSGSMGANITSKSEFSRVDVAMAMALMAVNACESIDVYVTAGSDSAGIHKTEKIKYPSRGFKLFDQISDCNVGGGGIFTRQCLDYIKKDMGKNKVDRIIVFSDSQDCDKSNQLPQPFGKNNYICDVSAHKNGVYYRGVWTAEIAGWSEKFLPYIMELEGLSVNVEDDE